MTRLTEKYRPKTWDEIIGNDVILRSIRGLIERRGVACPHLLFIGPSGNGKTSTAYVVKNTLEELMKDKFLVGVPLIEYNASDDRGIVFIRGEIKRQTEYLAFKILFLDEADALTTEAQNALRRIMEKTRTALFIFVGNNGDAFTEAFKSRCVEYRFEKISNELILDHLKKIITLEDIEIEDEESVDVALKILSIRSNGDMRIAINNLEKVITKNGKITTTSIQMYQPSRKVKIDWSKHEGLSTTERVMKQLEELKGKDV